MKTKGAEPRRPRARTIEDVPATVHPGVSHARSGGPSSARSSTEKLVAVYPSEGTFFSGQPADDAGDGERRPGAAEARPARAGAEGAGLEHDELVAELRARLTG
jgi:hypothetical protein